MAGGALAACILVKGSDGAACSKGSECKSEGCSNGTCSGSQCKYDGGDCPATGAPSPNCEEGWECAGTSSVRVIAFDDTRTNPGGNAEISVTVR